MATIEDYKRSDGLWAKSGTVKFESYKTKSHEVWLKMKQRCVSEIYQAKHPSYIGCFMSREFADYQLFADWCQTQIGYGLYQYDLDKDFLVPENKQYSAQTCCFIPHALNALFSTHANARGTLPIGVSQRRKNNKYCASIAINGKETVLARCDTVEQASNIYQQAKQSEIVRWIVRLSNKEFVVDPRIINALHALARS